MFLRLTAILLTSLLLVQLGCNQGSQDSHRVIGVDENDAAMNTAIETAKKTFSQFEQNWQNPNVETTSVKVGMDTSSGGKEHVWFTPISMEGTKITASCSNEPVEIPDLNFGDVRTFEKSQVSDWLIMQDGKCYGGYTVRVLMEQQPGGAPDMEFADYP
ncbi:DUF2314 domain-containing protein [Lignipirellula cremea]|uniref:DUF2314 domain-containing protein n=1 Tax=Lignipirellula cremea TaxID=2528010 RepID=A0A518DP74_9BACT|nr:DUF2314 domain-containing protein [Lignipirellula cremea]QDU93641.1 hypothetical protein Pla8534_14210 [Lignipirellula cremea]